MQQISTQSSDWQQFQLNIWKLFIKRSITVPNFFILTTIHYFFRLMIYIIVFLSLQQFSVISDWWLPLFSIQFQMNKFLRNGDPMLAGIAQRPFSEKCWGQINNSLFNISFWFLHIKIVLNELMTSKILFK